MAIFEDFITLKEASSISGYHPDYIGALVRSGKIHGDKKGRNWYVSKKEVEEHFMTKHYVPTKKVFFKPSLVVFFVLILLVLGGVAAADFFNKKVDEGKAPKQALTDYVEPTDVASQFTN